MCMSSPIFQNTLQCSLRVKEKRLLVISVYIYGHHTLRHLHAPLSACTDLKLFLFLFPIWFFLADILHLEVKETK